MVETNGNLVICAGNFVLQNDAIVLPNGKQRFYLDVQVLIKGAVRFEAGMAGFNKE